MNNILVAEDESRIASFVKKGLQKNGFKATIATDGEEVLQKIESQDFDLMLLDLGLPIIDGWTILKELRSQGNQIPVIIVSAYDSPEQTDRLTNYIAKPFRFQDLLKQIKYSTEQITTE